MGELLEHGIRALAGVDVARAMDEFQESVRGFEARADGDYGELVRHVALMRAQLRADSASDSETSVMRGMLGACESCARETVLGALRAACLSAVFPTSDTSEEAGRAARDRIRSPVRSLRRARARRESGPPRCATRSAARSTARLTRRPTSSSRCARSRPASVAARAAGLRRR